MSSPTATLVAREVSKSFGPRVVLDRVSITVPPGSRIGIVAPNGTGKSTLLHLLAGIDAPDSGVVSRLPPSATVGFLPQEPERFENETLRDFLGRRTGVTAATAAFEATTTALAAQRDRRRRPLQRGAGPLSRARRGRLRSPRCRDRRTRRSAPVFLDQPLPAMSGGQAARASLAAILLARFDVFLLDEPTNDLDFVGLDLLETFLSDLPSGVVIVSHDRAFLDRTIDGVLELDEHTHRSRFYAGGWRAYLEERALDRRHAQEEYETYTAKRNTLAARTQQQREWAVQGVSKVKKSGEKDKFIRQFRTASSERVAGKARRPNGPWSVSKPTRSRNRGSDGSSAWRSRPPRAVATWLPASRARP